MNVLFTAHGWQDYVYWQKNDKKILGKINDLIKDISRDPNGGIGKPEQLKNALSGWSSRRINLEHRLVYKIEQGTIIIAQCRYHY
ncbi:MAG: Txe/YoeB family addiction module toxin [Chitinophagaceae bacterium]|nr:MAG: Txe/YoeB family addiction module toxin [Chitinophagaceae bacterium]